MPKYLENIVAYIKGLTGLSKESREIIESRLVNTKSTRDYIVNKSFDVPALVKDIREAKLDAGNYFGSTLRKAVDEQNTLEARGMGLTHFSPNLNSVAKLLEPLGVQFEFNPQSKTLGWIINQDRILGNKATVHINLGQDASPSNTAFHEILHLGSHGEVEPQRANESFENYIRRIRDTKRFYRIKADKILKDFSEVDLNFVDPKVYNYIADNPDETAVHLLEMGRMLGVEPGLKYPGDEAFEALLNRIYEESENPILRTKRSIPKIIRHDTTEERERMWKAMNGTYFVWPLAVGIPTAWYMYGQENNEYD